MASTIHIKMIDKEVEIDLTNVLTQSTIKSQFLLPSNAVVSLSYEINDCQKGCHMNEAGTAFLIPKNFKEMHFLVDSDKMPSRPATPTHARPISPYPDGNIEIVTKNMFYMLFNASDSTGKLTVACVHPRYFVTFRDGTHLQLGNTIKIFPATAQDQPRIRRESGYEVKVVDINEKLDFILLRSKENIVETAPRLVRGEESEMFLLAGFGDMTSGSQKLAYHLYARFRLYTSCDTRGGHLQSSAHYIFRSALREITYGSIANRTPKFTKNPAIKKEEASSHGNRRPWVPNIVHR
ncbi:unnamed protein product [Auanema sp. JU1783]|nr:unnamed protein product [Auanema sp. JU1783]